MSPCSYTVVSLPCGSPALVVAGAPVVGPAVVDAPVGGAAVVGVPDVAAGADDSSEAPSPSLLQPASAAATTTETASTNRRDLMHA